MEVSMIVLGKMTLWAFFLGIAFGIFYDVIRITRVMLGVTYGTAKGSAEFLYSRTYPLIGQIIRKESKAKEKLLTFIVAAGDVIFCTVMGASFCIFLYYTNDGIFRWQAVAATAIGFFVYYKTIGAIILYFAEIISIFLKILTKILLYAIAFPFRIMYNIVIRMLKAVFGKPFEWCRIKFLHRTTKAKMKKLQLSSATGFLEDYLKGQELKNGKELQ
ncbi:MAG: spore cortex biosynthesis protein YabQ [Clostridia bacterium]|nr:spore cortex biosynthesis protein YabQ [Clostridia bacterium]